jgi:cell division protein FtsB
MAHLSEPVGRDLGDAHAAWLGANAGFSIGGLLSAAELRSEWEVAELEEILQIMARMNVDLGIWQKLSRLMAALIFLAAILAVVVWYIPLFRQNERMRKEIQSLQGQIRREEQAGRQLENQIKALREDPKTLERMAREKLGYAKTGETVLYFEQRVTNSPIVTPNR